MENPSLMKSKLCYQSEKENLDLSLNLYEITYFNPIYNNCKYYFRLQTRQWSDRVIRRETREWKVHGNMTIRKEVQVY